MRGISLKHAQQCLETSFNLARHFRLPPMAVVILDNGGHVKIAANEDGTGILRYEIAKAKAYAALAMSMNTMDLTQLIHNHILPEHFINSLATSSHGKFNANPGGVIIYEEKMLVGAIGLSGASAEMDDKIAKQAAKG